MQGQVQLQRCRENFMGLFPAFLKLEGRSGLVVGGGRVALEKAQALMAAGAAVRVVARRASREMAALAAEGRIALEEREFRPADLDGVFLAIAATDDPAANVAVYEAAVARKVLTNSVDDPPHCDFYFGAVAVRGQLQVAISTSGASPALAQRLRKEIDGALPPDLGPWLEETGRLRREVLAQAPANDERRRLLHRLAGREVCAAAHCAARVEAFGGAEPGRVYLTGAGPGDPDLLTVRAARLVATADVVLHDDLVPAAVVRLTRPEAVVRNVGKRSGTKRISQPEINALMIGHARAGRSVVRLKGGDPLIFGRAGEEMAALEEAGVEFEAVPGITAAFAAAAAIGAPLTGRGVSSTVELESGSHAGEAPTDASERMRVAYMPGRDLAELAARWRAEGLPGNLPCAVVSRASQPDQQILRTTLHRLGKTQPGPAPAIVLAGWMLAVDTALDGGTARTETHVPADVDSMTDHPSEPARWRPWEAVP